MFASITDLLRLQNGRTQETAGKSTDSACEQTHRIVELKLHFESGKTAVPSVASASARGWLQLSSARVRLFVCA
jgi:hypothetical protein